MLYITPSRGRPHNVAELIESWEATRSLAHLWVCVDIDDPTLDGYQSLCLPDWASLKVGVRLRLGATLNKYAMGAASVRCSSNRDSEIIGFMGDDHRPRTVGWDREFAQIGDVAECAVIYGNDLIQGRNLPTAVAITSNVIAALGYMVPPGMTHLFADNAWADMGRTLGNLVYREDIVIEHVHPITGKTPWDEGYVEVNSGERWSADEKAYRAWKSGVQPYTGWADRLRALKAGTGAVAT